MDNVDINFRMMASGNAVPELRKAQQGVKNLGDQIDRSQSRMRGFNNGITTMQANTRKFAMGGLQQAGFQLGDYAVQVANGTSKMQAFGQQAPQFLQIFGPIGSIVGAGVAALAAFAVIQEKTAGASKSLTDNLMPLDEALKSIKNSTAEARGEIALLASGFKTVEEASLANAISLQKQVVAQKELNLENARGIAKVGAETSLKNAEEQLQVLKDQLLELRSGNKERDRTLEAMTDIIGSTEGLKQSEQALNDIFESRIGKIDDTANLYSDILGTESGLGAAVAANNALYAARIGTIDDTANNYVDILGSESGLKSAVKGLNDLYQARLGTIDDTANKYIDILGSEAGLGAAVAANNALYAARIGTIDDTANNYVDVLGSEEGLRSAQEASIELYRKSLEESEKLKSNVKDTAKAVNSDLSPEMERLKKIQDSVSRSFESGFMSIVDGTQSVKDAFRSMASDIIKELYRIFVVKKITGLISNAIGGFGSSAPVTSLRPVMRSVPSANGGGYTGNGARAGGLDGKGGFMAMIHPRETVVDHTKGQGMGGVTVIQNNTFGSGVSRAEVNAMLPKMVEATKAAVADAKLRGGSYGRSFA